MNLKVRDKLSQSLISLHQEENPIKKLDPGAHPGSQLICRRVLAGRGGEAKSEKARANLEVGRAEL